MKSKRVLSVILMCMLLTLGMVPIYAATTQEKIDNARAARNETRSSLEETKNKIKGLESKKGESEVYLSELSIQLENLRNSLEQLQVDEEQKQAELEIVQIELEEARAQEEKQYEDMKLRIQFMYEKSSGDYLVMLLSASDFTDFLNRAENISQISEYDREMLKNYQETQEIIREKEEQVQEEKRAIAVLKEENAVRHAEVEVVMDSTNEQIKAYKMDIRSAESEEANLLSRISNQENEINGLIEQARTEEAARVAQAQAEARAKAAAKASTSSSNSTSSSSNNSPSTSSSNTASNSTSNSSASNNSSNQSTDNATPEPAAPTPEPSTGQGTYLGKFKLTAYCSCSKCCGKWAGGPTASGVMPTAGRTVAMGGVPFGTKLSINGTIYTVEDRGTGYGHVDIFMGSHSAALGFGRQYAEVYQVN